MKSGFLIFTCMFLMFGCSSYSVQELSITAQEFDSTIMLTVPVSKVKMTIPKLEFVKQRENPTKSYRYFYYWDTSLQLGISGWFESALLFKGTQIHWNDFLTNWKGIKPTDVSFEKLNGWEIIYYNMDVESCSQANAKAFLIKNETWIEIHVSALCKEGSEQADIAGFIQQISVEDKV